MNLQSLDLVHFVFAALPGDFAPMRSDNDERTLRPLWVKSGHVRRKTYVRFTPDSAAKANFRKEPCLLCPRKRTCAVQLGMSALGQ
jgi:hypothetical protein